MGSGPINGKNLGIFIRILREWAKNVSEILLLETEINVRMRENSSEMAGAVLTRCGQSTKNGSPQNHLPLAIIGWASGGTRLRGAVLRARHHCRTPIVTLLTPLIPIAILAISVSPPTPTA